MRKFARECGALCVMGVACVRRARQGGECRPAEDVVCLTAKVTMHQSGSMRLTHSVQALD